MIKDIWDAAKEILHLADAISKAPLQERQQLSAILTEISELVNQIYFKLKEHIYPAGSCTQLDHFAEKLYGQWHTLIGKEKAIQLLYMLTTTDKTEKLFHEIAGDKIFYDELQKLEEASGKFKACAIIISRPSLQII